MPKSHFRISYIIVILLISVLLIFLGFTKYQTKVPREVYQIYIDGEIIGTVKSKTNFEEFINKKEEAKKRYENATKEPHAKASACVQCGQCEVQCPQHIEIRSWLKRVSEVLE